MEHGSTSNAWARVRVGPLSKLDAAARELRAENQRIEREYRFVVSLCVKRFRDNMTYHELAEWAKSQGQEFNLSHRAVRYVIERVLLMTGDVRGKRDLERIMSDG